MNPSRRRITKLLTVLLSLSLASQTVVGVGRAGRRTSFAAASTGPFLHQTLAEAFVGGRFRTLLRHGASLPSLRWQAQAFRDWLSSLGWVPAGPMGFPVPDVVPVFQSTDEQPESSEEPGDPLHSQPGDMSARDRDRWFAEYEKRPLRLRQAAITAARKGEPLRVPKSAVSVTGFDDEGRPKPLPMLGALLLPPERVRSAFARAREVYLEELKALIINEKGLEAGTAAFERLMACLVPLPETSFHSTVAGEGRMTPATGANSRDAAIIRRLLKRLREITRFSAQFSFRWKGKYAVLEEGTPTIGVFLEFKDPIDSLRFHDLKSALGSHLPVKAEVAHLSFLYVRGRPENGERLLSDEERLWLHRAASRAEARNARAPEAVGLTVPTSLSGTAQDDPYLDWPVEKVEVISSRAIGQFVHEGEAPLLHPDRYRDLIRHGQAELALHWGLRSEQDYFRPGPDGVMRWRKLDAVRGMFPSVHLRSVRGLWAAIGAGALSPDQVLRLVRHATKVRVASTFDPVLGKAWFRVSAKHFRQPGFLTFLSRALDSAHATVTELRKRGARGPLGGQLTADIAVENVDQPGYEAIAAALASTPDLGWEIPFGPVLEDLRWRVIRWWYDMVSVHVVISFQAAAPEGATKSVRSDLLEAVRNLEPRSRVSDFMLDEVGPLSVIRMSVEVPRGLAPRVPGQLALVVRNIGTVKAYDPGEGRGTPAPKATIGEKLGVPAAQIETEEERVMYRRWTAGKRVKPSAALRFASLLRVRSFSRSVLTEKERTHFYARLSTGLEQVTKEPVVPTALPSVSVGMEHAFDGKPYLKVVVDRGTAAERTLNVMIVDSDPGPKRRGGAYFVSSEERRVASDGSAQHQPHFWVFVERTAMDWRLVPLLEQTLADTRELVEGLSPKGLDYLALTHERPDPADPSMHDWVPYAPRVVQDPPLRPASKSKVPVLVLMALGLLFAPVPFDAAPRRLGAAA